MATKAVSVNQTFRALSDPTRLRILHLLLAGELCVCDIVDIIQVPQPTASRHLAYLRRVGLVNTERRGLWTYYSLTRPKGGFQTRLMECIRCCEGEMEQIRRDGALLKKRQGMGCC